MTAPSSFSVSGLLGGPAGSIDTNALISQLMQAAALPQTRLKNQLAVEQAIETAYQTVTMKITAMQTAAQALTDPTAWSATSATSTSTGVLATSTSSALAGTTTFDVLALAKAQISTVAADSAGNVVSTPANGISITTGDGVAHQIALTSGSAADVAAAVNSANIGLRAAVVNTDTGAVLQLTSSASGVAHSFTAAGFDAVSKTVVSAQDAQIGVGAGSPGGYTVSSATNTFTGVIPGVTFSVSALATGVSITVASDEQSISDKLKALVDSVNAASSAIGQNIGKGDILQGTSDVQMVQQSLLSSVSRGTLAGGSLKTFGIDMDQYGTLSFDPAAFAAAYAADPAGTRTAVSGSFATALTTVANTATDPTAGTLTQGQQAAKDAETALNKQIDAWTARLSDMQVTLQAKYTAMQTTLAKLQSQSTYLTSMLKNQSSDSST